MDTVAESLARSAELIRGLLEDLVLRHSSIYMWNEPGGGFVLISAHGDYGYRELDTAGRQIQSKLLEEYRRFHSLLTVFLAGQPKDSLKALAGADEVLSRTIEQQPTWCKTTQEAYTKAKGALEGQLQLIRRLYDASAGEPTYLPDTNALIYNPSLQDWAFSQEGSFTIALLPPVLAELDVLKTRLRTDDVRDKAESLIRQIKEYRRRGSLTEGVPLRKGVSSILAIATEPKMDASLPWLEPTNADDRFLASAIEVMRTRPRSPVVLVTRDINLQNKAEFARLPYVEPPEPAAA